MPVTSTTLSSFNVWQFSGTVTDAEIRNAWASTLTNGVYRIGRSIYLDNTADLSGVQGGFVAEVPGFFLHTARDREKTVFRNFIFTQTVGLTHPNRGTYARGWNGTSLTLLPNANDGVGLNGGGFIYAVVGNAGGGGDNRFLNEMAFSRLDNAQITSASFTEQEVQPQTEGNVILRGFTLHRSQAPFAQIGTSRFVGYRGTVNSMQATATPMSFYVGASACYVDCVITRNLLPVTNNLVNFFGGAGQVTFLNNWRSEMYFGASRTVINAQNFNTNGCGFWGGVLRRIQFLGGGNGLVNVYDSRSTTAPQRSTFDETGTNRDFVATAAGTTADADGRVQIVSFAARYIRGTDATITRFTGQRYTFQRFGFRVIVQNIDVTAGGDNDLSSYAPVVLTAQPNLTRTAAQIAAATEVIDARQLSEEIHVLSLTLVGANSYSGNYAGNLHQFNGVALETTFSTLTLDSAAASKITHNATLNTLTVRSSTFATAGAVTSLVNAGDVVISGTLMPGCPISAVNITLPGLTNTGIFTASGILSGLPTSGAISTAGALSFNTSSISATGDLTISNTALSGTLTINTATARTLTLTNVTGAVNINVTGGGTLVVLLNNSTIGTIGAGVTTQLVTSLTISSLLADSQIYVADNTGTQAAYVSSSGTSYHLDTTGGTGTWTWRVRKYGYEDQTGTFTPATSSQSVVAAYLVDAFVVDTLVNVTAYADLQTTQKIYDYSRYFATTNAGIALAAQFDKGFGTLTANSALTLNPSAPALMAAAGGIVTTKTSGLAENVTVVVSGNFTQNAATLSNDVKIRAANLDSEILFSGIDSLTIYATQSDALTNTNPGATSNTGIIRYEYGAALSGVTMSATVYVRTLFGTTLQVQALTLLAGETTFDLSTSALLQSVLTNVENVPTETWTYNNRTINNALFT